MTSFLIQFEDRQAGAIGICESSSEIIQADSSKEAYNKIREKRYNLNRELLLIKSIKADWNDTGDYTHVEPASYLYNE